jgi:hypothetical protein
MIPMSGCSKNTAQQKPAGNSSSEQKPKAPSELKTLSVELDQLIAELDKKMKAQEKSPLQQKSQLNPMAQNQNQSQGQEQGQSQSQSNQGQAQQSGQSSQSSNNQSNNQNQSSNSGQGGQSQQSQTATSAQKSPTQGTSQSTPATTDWQKEFAGIKKIHTSWNSIMPEAVEAGMTVEARNQFNKSLDQLTQDVSQQKLEASMTSALTLYKNYADMAQIFSNSVPAEYYQVKYALMNTIFTASQQNWTSAEQMAAQARQHWAYLAAQAKDADQKAMSRADFAIMDLEQAVKNRQKDLIIIKGEIAMTNLKNLENKLSTQSGGQQNSGSQGQNQNQSQGQTQSINQSGY